MATSFEISNGDIKVSNTTGRPNLVGNIVGENNTDQARKKVSQDIQRGLTLNALADGTTAGVAELVGSLNDISGLGIEFLLNRQIRNMFSSILRVQSIRPSVRPDNERFSSISFLQIFLATGSKTTYRFRLGIRTVDGGIAEQTGSIG